MKTLSPHRNSRRKAFTLMELLLVLAIIGLLVGGGAAAYGKIMDSARETKAGTQIGTLGSLMQGYQAKFSKLPSQAAGLRALVTARLTDEDQLRDPWGNDFVYLVPAKRSKDRFDIFSKGVDGLEGTVDDIGNWTPTAE